VETAPPGDGVMLGIDGKDRPVETGRQQVVQNAPADRVFAVRCAENRDGARGKQPIKIMRTH
jgi:hypothetical protein